ncbi:MAG: 30S ribosome-binding factor RbfA [Coriobacteriales bacterium]|nr:30S ribosome-binding factor RbfA [Coriobacteriales bacterium]
MSRSPRARRLDETVREKLAYILTEEISDPRLDLVTLTGVQVTSDHSYADVYVIAHGDQERYDEALAGLESAKGRIRSLLARTVRTRTVPELRFHIDTSVDEGMRIDEALKHVPPTIVEAETHASEESDATAEAGATGNADALEPDAGEDA